MTNHPIVHLGSRASTRGWGQARQRSPGEPEQRGSGADSCGRVTAAAERTLCLARGGRRRWRSRGDPAVCLPALLGFLVFPARFSPFPPTLRASSSLSKAISFCRSQLRVGFRGSPLRTHPIHRRGFQWVTTTMAASERSDGQGMEGNRGSG